MERVPLPENVTPELRRLYEYLMDEAPGRPITLQAAPTTAGGELKENQRGIFGSDLYMNINGTTYRFSGTPV